MKIHIAFDMPVLNNKEYVLKCNQSISKEPFKVFEIMNFVKNFNPEQRKYYAIEIRLVGKMEKPINWEIWLNGIKKDYIVDKSRAEVSRRLFRERMPLMPRVVSQEKNKDSNDKNAEVHNNSDLNACDPEFSPIERFSLRNDLSKKNANLKHGDNPDDVASKQMSTSVFPKKVLADCHMTNTCEKQQPEFCSMEIFAMKKKRVHEPNLSNMQRKRNRKSNNIN